VSDVSDDPDGIFTCRVQHRSQHPLSTKHLEFALSVAVVETCIALWAQETTVRGVYAISDLIGVSEGSVSKLMPLNTMSMKELTSDK
jgi:hypothetical protein